MKVDRLTKALITLPTLALLLSFAAGFIIASQSTPRHAAVPIFWAGLLYTGIGLPAAFSAARFISRNPDARTGENRFYVLFGLSPPVGFAIVFIWTALRNGA
jgi:hypothetical protein